MGREANLLHQAEALEAEWCDETRRYIDFAVAFREVVRDGEADGEAIVPTGRCTKVYGWRYDRFKPQADGRLGGYIDADELDDIGVHVLDCNPRQFEVLHNDWTRHFLVYGSRRSSKTELLARFKIKNAAKWPNKGSSTMLPKRKKARKFVREKLLPLFAAGWLRRASQTQDELAVSCSNGHEMDFLSAVVKDDARADGVSTAEIDETQLAGQEARANLMLSLSEGGSDFQTLETATLLDGEFMDYLEQAKQNDRYEVIELSVTDNVHLKTTYDPETRCQLPEFVLSQRAAMPKALFEQEIGIWDATAMRFRPAVWRPTGLAYFGFERGVHDRPEGEESKAVAVLRGLYQSAHRDLGQDITRRVARAARVVGVSFDEGLVAGVGGRIFATPPGAPDLLWITHEWGDDQGDVRAFCKAAKLSGFAGAAAVPDAIGNDSEGGQSSISLMRSEGLAIRGGAKNALARNRRNAVNGKLRNGSNQVSLLISRRCVNLLAALKNQRVARSGHEQVMERGEHRWAQALGHLVHHFWPIKAIDKQFGYAA